MWHDIVAVELVDMSRKTSELVQVWLDITMIESIRITPTHHNFLWLYILERPQDVSLVLLQCTEDYTTRVVSTEALQEEGPGCESDWESDWESSYVSPDIPVSPYSLKICILEGLNWVSRVYSLSGWKADKKMKGWMEKVQKHKCCVYITIHLCSYICREMLTHNIQTLHITISLI